MVSGQALGYLNWWALSSPDLAPQHLFEVLNCQTPGLRCSSPNHPIMHQLLCGPMEPAVQMYADAHLDQVHLARPHEVKREPIKRAVMPVTIGSAGGGAGVEGALERAALAHAETQRPLTGHAPPHPEHPRWGHCPSSAHCVPLG